MIPSSLRVRSTRETAYRDRLPTERVAAKIPSSTDDSTDSNDSTDDLVEDSVVDETEPTHDSTGSDRLSLTADDLSPDDNVLVPPDPPEWEEPDVEDQLQLGEFEDTLTSSSSTWTFDERLDDLPVFLDDDEIPSSSIADPNRMGPEYCGQCGARHSLDEPLERGIGSLRGGEALEGPSSYIACDDVRSCDCCGCPACGSTVRRRKTKSPTFACQSPNCDAEFENPIPLPDETPERERLYWSCRDCGGATQAPFVGIPVSRIGD